MIWFLGCLHTPPHAEVAGRVHVDYQRQEFMDPSGQWCAYDAESLWFEQQALWSEEPPDAPNGCRPPGEESRIVDVVGQDGPFVSAILKEWGCCPEHQSLRCVTFDVRTGQPVSLDTYDEKNALKREEKLKKAWAKLGAPSGYALSPDSFLVGGGHIRFCAIKNNQFLEVKVP